jgi:hypothetical protein
MHELLETCLCCRLGVKILSAGFSGCQNYYQHLQSIKNRSHSILNFTMFNLSLYMFVHVKQVKQRSLTLNNTEISPPECMCDVYLLLSTNISYFSKYQ